MIFIDVTFELTINSLGDKSELPCHSAMDFHFDDCLLDKIPTRLVGKYGCTIPYIPGPPEYPICNATKDEALAKNAVEKYKFLASNGQDELCERPCTNIEVLTGLPFYGVIKGFSYMKIYFKSTTKVNKTVLDYTWISMVAEIGGYSGLLLGISLVNLTWVIDRVIRRIRAVR